MKKILTFGVFDYFHLGHLRLFKQCKEHADYLIVAVQNSDYILKFKPDAKIRYSTNERVEILEALRIVDRVVVYDSLCSKTLETIDFDILALGEDHRGGRFDERCRFRPSGKNRCGRLCGICSWIPRLLHKYSVKNSPG